MKTPPLAGVAIVALLAPSAVRPSPRDEAPLTVERTPPAPDLEVTPRRAAVLAGTAVVLWGAAAIQSATEDPTECRWCEPGRLDRWVRDGLRWDDTDAAGKASDVLLYATTLGSAAAVAWQASREGDRRELVEDVLLVAASVAVTDGVTRIVQHGTDRLRPYAWASGEPPDERELRSFFSGHGSRAFAAAAAATQVARLRGRGGWGWIAAATFTGAAATAWMRVAADQHWATDVLAAAAAGTAVGLVIPTLSLRPASRGSGAKILPAPGGIAIVF